MKTFIAHSGWIGLFAFVFWYSQAAVSYGVEKAMVITGISPNHSVAGAYSMEVFCTMAAVALILWRVVAALKIAKTMGQMKDVLFSRAGIVSFSIAAIVTTIASNRLYWWYKHLFTEDRFDYTSYTNSGISVFVSLVAAGLIAAIYTPKSTDIDKPDLHPQGIQIGSIVYGLGCLAYIAGLMVYNGPA